MSRFKKVLLSLLLAVALVLPSTNAVFADANPNDFSVNPVLPNNQKKGVEGYYDLIVKPGDKQTLTLQINNGSDKKATYEVYANPAFTSDGGSIDYSKRTKKVDSTVPFNFRDAVTLKTNKYTVAAKSSIKVPIEVSIPNQDWKGRVIGGINIQKTGDGTQTKTDGNAALNTKIAYSVAVILQTKEEQITPDLKYLKTGPAKVNGYAVIQETFRNPTATIIPDLEFKSVIKKDGKKYITNTSNKYTVAPNTKFHVNLGMDGQRIEPGTYTVKITATSGKFYKWVFEDKFTIKASEADKINKNAIFPKKEGPNIWLIIAIVVAIIAIILLIIVIVRQNNQKNKSRKKKR